METLDEHDGWPEWPPPDGAGFTLDGAVGVWLVPLDVSGERLAAAGRLLSADEGQRAARFVFDQDRARYTAARAALRILLGSLLGVDPPGLRFRLTGYGKPVLDVPDGSLQFNVSHSAGLALIAVANTPVGVDIELIKPEFAGLDVAGRFFSPREVEALRRTPSGLQTEAFFRCWTRKEAYIKGVGLGLSIPLDSFDVPMTAGMEDVWLRPEGDGGQAARWSLRELRVPPGFLAAVAAEGTGWDVRCWRLGDPAT